MLPCRSKIFGLVMSRAWAAAGAHVCPGPHNVPPGGSRAENAIRILDSISVNSAIMNTIISLAT